MKTTNEIKTVFIGKPYLLTFEVTFTEDYTHQSGIYEANATYRFQTNVISDNEGEMYDDSYSDLHHYFGLIDGNTYTGFLPIFNPVIIEVKEVQQ